MQDYGIIVRNRARKGEGYVSDLVEQMTDCGGPSGKTCYGGSIASVLAPMLQWAKDNDQELINVRLEMEYTREPETPDGLHVDYTKKAYGTIKVTETTYEKAEDIARQLLGRLE